MGARTRMAYWHDLVRDIAPAAGIPGVFAAQDRDGAGSPDVDAALIAAGLAPDHTAAREFAQKMARRLAGDTRSGAYGAKALPDFIRRPVARWAIETFIRDTAAYFFKPGMRQKIRQRLSDQLPTDGTPVVIVAHSHGSIVAYEVLRALEAAQVEVQALVTVGSPLGMEEIQDLLEPAVPQMPLAVGRWFNFAAWFDPVPLDTSLADDYPAHAAAHAVRDEMVVNRKLNPHSAVGYLTVPRIRNLVRDEMRVDRFAPFVLARDVAERLGEPDDVRFSVLIEAIEPGRQAPGESDDEARAFDRSERLSAGEPKPLTLEQRVQQGAALVESIVGDKEAAQVDPLRRFISARLTAGELRLIAQAHREMRVYSVWSSSRKAKLTQRSMRALKADAALASFEADGSGITWAVLDTGIRGDHPHFAAGEGESLVEGVWDCTKRGAPKWIAAGESRDPDGHGTHVAGIISGQAPASAGTKQRGAAPKARLVIYKVLDDQGQGEDAWIIKALDHIAEQNENASGGLAIHGLNLSLGGPFDTSVYGCGFSPVCQELRRLWRDGVLVVVACGNEGRLEVRTPDGDTEISTPMSIGDPANLEDCIAVGSVHADQPHLYGISSFSSRGPTADGRAKPDCVAPGEGISSANSRYRSKQSLYYEESGTSMAAPHVSGILAAFLSVRREFRGRPDEVKKILLQTCTDIGRDRYHQGAGVPNLMQMLMAV